MYLDNCSQVSVSCIQIQIDISSRLFHLDVFAVTLLCHKYTPKDKKCPFALSFVFMASESHGKVTTSRWKSRGLTTIAAPRHDAQHPRGGGREVCGSPGRSDRAHTEHRQQHHGDHPQERQGRGENGHSFCLSLSRLSQQSGEIIAMYSFSSRSTQNYFNILVLKPFREIGITL